MSSHHRGPPAEVLALDTFIKLLRAEESLGAALARGTAATGLTPTQFAVLEALFHLGPLCQRDLGHKLLKSSGNVTLVLDNLEREGLVQRQRSTSDRRYVAVHLTDAGRERITRVFPAHAAAVTALFSALSEDEQRELGRLCKKLGRAAEEAAGRKRSDGGR